MTESLLQTDSGYHWDGHLELFQTGVININFYENLLGFTAGDCISGTVDIVLFEAHMFTKLVIEFVGKERQHTTKTGERKNEEIIRFTALVSEFCEEFQPGQYSYPFYVYLPEWLPDSMHFRNAS
jgi:hypothetical protein